MNEAIKPAIKRLFDAQAHWHNANKQYFDPNAFRMLINSCIQELRNVTFVLQSNKRGIEGFDEWYEPWQDRMRSNKSLRWLVSARNYIVKQGDLELKSMLRIEVIGSYLAGEVKIFEQDYEVNISSKEIFQKTIDSGMPKEVLENSYVKLQRKWIDSNYPDYELLELLGICWIAVAELLFDAPGATDDEINRINETRIPPCMYQGSETRSIWMKVQDDDLVPTQMHQESITITKTDAENSKERYGDSPFLNKKINPTNFKELCELFLEQAMFVLKKDGYHVHLVVIFVDSKIVAIKELRNEDQTDKYRTLRLVASEMEKIGANQFLMVSEAWTAPFDPNYPHRHAADCPDRQEALNLIGVNKSGEGYFFMVPFSRGVEGITYGEVSVNGIEGLNIIQPIISIWEKSNQNKS
ncbi:hypothetical protein CWO84_23485 [Methylomonas sp. Kb3]|uniref:hypothetical protein n=1 Tax=Methylomonas sp. Kb3 TaxID=1611544 RepID=UPI000C34C181|nr:hypothetical protein [Methylomonas sp. Kb3]PKD38187.1 hypothetical protein CWO84_23485 [Methylomonas sp. Kb3]